MSYRDFLDKAAASGDLITIDKPVSPRFELANVAHALERKTVPVTHVEAHPGSRLNFAPCAHRILLTLTLVVPIHQLTQHLAPALPPPRSPLRSATPVARWGHSPRGTSPAPPHP